MPDVQISCECPPKKKKNSLEFCQLQTQRESVAERERERASIAGKERKHKSSHTHTHSIIDKHSIYSCSFAILNNKYSFMRLPHLHKNINTSILSHFTRQREGVHGEQGWMGDRGVERVGGGGGSI